MQNSNLLQKIGIVIILVSLSVRLIGKFLNDNISEMISDFHLISVLGIAIWTVGYFRKHKATNLIVPDSKD